jgi:energy-coupling factor transport system ATP-binding protein
MMSYGSRKHLQAAVYYILERPFVIIDELDSGVTYAAAYEIISLLRLRGAAVVIITHDQEFAKSLATRQYVIENKEVIEKGEYGDN